MIMEQKTPTILTAADLPLLSNSNSSSPPPSPLPTEAQEGESQSSLGLGASDDKHYVKVQNISKLIKQEDVLKLFEFLGTVVDSKVYQSMINSSAMEALLEVESQEMVDMALHLTGTKFGDRSLIITKITGAQLRAAESATGGLKRGSDVGIAMHAQQRLRPVDMNPAHRTVYMSNVPLEATIKIVADFFSSCGTVTAVKDLKQAVDYKFVKVEFAAPHAADAAATLDGAILLGRPLKINKAMNVILGYGPGAAINPPPPLPPASALPPPSHRRVETGGSEELVSRMSDVRSSRRRSRSPPISRSSHRRRSRSRSRSRSRDRDYRSSRTGSSRSRRDDDYRSQRRSSRDDDYRRR